MVPGWRRALVIAGRRPSGAVPGWRRAVMTTRRRPSGIVPGWQRAVMVAGQRRAVDLVERRPAVVVTGRRRAVVVKRDSSMVAARCIVLGRFVRRSRPAGSTVEAGFGRCGLHKRWNWAVRLALLDETGQCGPRTCGWTSANVASGHVVSAVCTNCRDRDFSGMFGRKLNGSSGRSDESGLR